MNPKNLIPSIRWTRESMDDFKRMFLEVPWSWIPFIAMVVTVSLPILIFAGLTHQFFKKFIGENENDGSNTEA